MPEASILANPDSANSRLIVGCGYLGRRIAAVWLAAGRTVYGVTRGRTAELRSLGIEPIVADVTDAVSLPALPVCATTVFCVGFDRHAGRSMREVYVAGLANVLSALPKGGRFIYVSSSGVYGDAGGNWIDEASPTNPVDESGRIVLEAEQLMQHERPETIILRFAGIYGPGRLLRRAESLRAGEPIAVDPEKWLNLIHVDDGAAAVAAAEAHGRPSEIYNVCDDCPVRRGEFFRMLAQALAAPAPTFMAPAGDRERGDRRVSNQKMRRELQVDLKCPSFRTGLNRVG